MAPANLCKQINDLIAQVVPFSVSNTAANLMETSWKRNAVPFRRRKERPVWRAFVCSNGQTLLSNGHKWLPLCIPVKPLVWRLLFCLQGDVQGLSGYWHPEHPEHPTLRRAAGQCGKLGAGFSPWDHCWGSRFSPWQGPSHPNLSEVISTSFPSPLMVWEKAAHPWTPCFFEQLKWEGLHVPWDHQHL